MHAIQTLKATTALVYPFGRRSRTTRRYGHTGVPAGLRGKPDKRRYSRSRLRFFLAEWQKITSDKFILHCVQGYKIKFSSEVYQDQKPLVLFDSKNGKENCREAILTLINKSAIEICKPKKGQFLSSYFLVKKPDGSYRFILNLKKLNKFIKTNHFKLEDLRTAIKLIFPDDFMASIDLEDAYYTVPIYEDSRKYLQFQFSNTIYEFVCLPFGLCTAPFIFTKLLKPVAKFLRSRGLSSVIYLDDFLCIEETREKCKNNVLETRELLSRLGFIINNKKSQFEPSTRCKFLGFIIDSIKYHIELTEKKRQNLCKMIINFISKKRCSIKDLAQLIGSLVAACPAIEYGLLYTELLEKEKLFSLIINDYDYNKSIIIPKHLITELDWWKNSLKNSVNPIKSGNFKVVIYTDASLTGWGAVNDDRRIHDF